MSTQAFAQWLHDQGFCVLDLVGTTGNIFLGRRPDSPDDLLAVVPTGGPTPALTDEYELHRFQVWVRDASFTTGETRAQAIHDAVTGRLLWQLPGGTLVVHSRCLQARPPYLGADEKGRHDFSINVEMEVRNTART